jgi:hypothetical protein
MKVETHILCGESLNLCLILVFSEDSIYMCMITSVLDIVYTYILYIQPLGWSVFSDRREFIQVWMECVFRL